MNPLDHPFSPGAGSHPTLGPVRAKLIKKGMIYSPSHGEMEFTVPLFDEFLKRAIPQFSRARPL